MIHRYHVTAQHDLDNGPRAQPIEEMAMMVDDTLTARNRINQRNFRARRQNYIKDLEERLRKYESEGVQATIEIQTAARQVTEQNIKLRALLMSRFGMNDHEIENYLNTHGPPLSIHSSLLPVSLATGLTSKPAETNVFGASQALAPLTQQSTVTSSSSILSPALGLASLHKGFDYPSSNEHPSKKQRLDMPVDDAASLLTTDQFFKTYGPSSSARSAENSSSVSSSQDRNSNERDPDTLSESSNPHTPAEQQELLPRGPHKVMKPNGTVSNNKSVLLDSNGYQFLGMATSTNGYHEPSIHRDDSIGRSSAHTKEDGPISKSHVPGDETACEDAARIIASMRGINERPEQILMELGCGPTRGTESCKVKNLSIFSLMDRT